MFAKLHLLSQDAPEGGSGLLWRAHPYLRMAGEVPKGPAVFDWSARQREDLEALWRDPAAEGARERLAKDLAVFCDKLGWTPDPDVLADAEAHGDEYLLTLSAVPPELYLLPWEVIQVGAAGTYLSDYASAQVRYAMPGLEPREIWGAPPAPGVLFAWSGAGGAVPHEAQAAAIRAAAEAGGVTFRALAEVDEASLQAALDAGPPSVLHLLCHGVPGPEGEPPRLRWGASDSPSEITATRLARMLRRHHGAIRLVVLSACGSGDGRGDPLFLSSLAQELHRKGIPSVVASRYPLSVRGARVMTRALYDKLLREAWSLERALRHTREALLRVDEDGESHAGDAYGIQLYAYDTERFVSDNDAVAERPVLASYPFGTAARPVPASAPPAAALTLDLSADPGLSEDQLAGTLRRVSEDASLTVAPPPDAAERARSLIVRTTVDGAQRLLGAWRSKALQVAVGVIVGQLIVTKGILPAIAGAPSAAAKAGKAAKAAKATGQQAASSSTSAAAPGQAAVVSGQAAATVTGKATLAVAGKALTAKLAIGAALGITAVVGGGVAVYRVATSPSAPVALVATDARVAAPPAPASQVVDAAVMPPPAVDAAVIVADAGGPTDTAPSPADRSELRKASVRSSAPVVAPPLDAAGPSLDAAAPPDAAALRPDAAVPPPDAAVLPPDAAAPPPDAAAAPVVATGPELLHLTLVFTLKKGATATLFRSRNYGLGTPVGFLIPPQDTVRGPAKLVTGTKPGAAKLLLSGTARSTGKPQSLELQGIRSTHCGDVPMNVLNGSATCGGGKNQSILMLTIGEAGNATVPPDVYTGSLRIEARGGNTKPSELVFDYEITIERDLAGAKTEPGGQGSAKPPVDP
jgi:CHAT domain